MSDRIGGRRERLGVGRIDMVGGRLQLVVVASEELSGAAQQRDDIASGDIRREWEKFVTDAVAKELR